MRRVRTRDTAAEVLLRKTLWARGLRGWRVDVRGIPGRPDIAWKAHRIAVFVDGAFWHGHPDVYHGQSGAFWDRKIAANRERDSRVNEQLREEGWTVLRFWDFDVEREPEACARRIQDALAVNRSRPRNAA
jgi:DNA mismatch endonuclease (patch repair protein)